MLLKDVLVDEGLKRQLTTLADENRISHAQLFLGKSGSHSFALALAYAQYICCTDRHDGDSCGHCHSCVMFEKLQHPDLHLIFPNCTYGEVKKDPDSQKLANYFREFAFANRFHLDYSEWVKWLKSENKQVNINIRDCAYIVGQNSMRSYENGYKIYILWMADKIQTAAANKLLKTLEEPESQSLFILLAESSDQILPTILSRTQLVKIPPISEENIKQHLIDEEHLSAEKAADIAAIAEGSYLKALRISQEDSSLHHLLTTYNLLMKSLTAYLHDKRDYARIDYLKVSSMLTDIAKDGKEAQRTLLNYLSRMFRNELLLNTGQSALVKATADEWKVLDEHRQFFTVKNAALLLNDCNQALYHVERNINAGILFTDFYFKLLLDLSKK
ncbi:MAG: hypothetical protein II757_05415 [Bacteroidales bacterium]|nr:hypothetical protein [Bacteroidales bacterium]